MIHRPSIFARKSRFLIAPSILRLRLCCCRLMLHGEKKGREKQRQREPIRALSTQPQSALLALMPTNPVCGFLQKTYLHGM
jgi:hypothetical protein